MKRTICSVCKKDLTCPCCQGEGKVICNDELYEFCCGKTRYSNFCSECGKQLKMSDSPVLIQCPECYGYGTILHHSCLTELSSAAAD